MDGVAIIERSATLEGAKANATLAKVNEANVHALKNCAMP